MLDITFHAGIELDICPRCRGVWLDRGELDRLGSDTSHSSRREHTHRTRSDEHRHDRNRDDRHRDDRFAKKKRKKRISDRLGDVFEEIIDL